MPGRKTAEQNLEQTWQLALVLDAQVRDDLVHLHLRLPDQTEKTLQIGMDAFYQQGIRVGRTLTPEQVQALEAGQKKEQAYARCLKKLAVRDRSVSEMRLWLHQNTECKSAQIESLLGRLQQKGYLDDARYVREESQRLQAQLLGPERIARQLRNCGIAEDLIQQALQAYTEADQQEAALAYGQKILRSRQASSQKKKQQVLQSRLQQRGFSRDLAVQAAGQLCGDKEETEQLASLQACAGKARKRYARKKQGRQLKEAVLRYCLMQGYEYEEISHVLSGMEWNDDEDQGFS